MAYGETQSAHPESALPMHAEPPAPPTKTARFVAMVVTILVVIGLGLGIVGRMSRERSAAAARSGTLRERRAAANLPPEVRIERPTPFAYNPIFSVTGSLDPAQEADLSFSVPGRLLRIEVELGQHVEKGQLLASLDRRSISAQSAMVSASAEAAAAQLALAEDRLRRTQALAARGAASDADLEGARRQVDLARAQLDQARAQGRMVSSDGSNHLLRAPFAGTITRVPNGVGQVVQPGAAVFRIEDMSAVVLRTGITERALGRIATGDTVELELFPGLRGEVRAFARSLDPITRRAPVEIGFPNADGRLIGHQLVKGSISCDRPFPVMRVSGTAIRSDSTVFVVGPDSRLVARPVEAVVERDGSGMVFFGITPEDRVVSRPSSDLEPGAQVRIASGG